MPLFEALGALWRELEARSDGGFFLSWDWVGCWIEETGLKPGILIGRDQGEVVLLAALVPTRRCGCMSGRATEEHREFLRPAPPGDPSQC
jgi:hypothetical protein